MNRSTRIAAGLLIPSLAASIILVLIYPTVSAMEVIDPMTVLLMLGFIITSVASAVTTAYFFRGLTFRKKADLWLLYLNTYPWVIFIALFFSRFWILILPLIFTPVLGYWFAKRFAEAKN